jgi:hypothetical protein
MQPSGFRRRATSVSLSWGEDQQVTSLIVGPSTKAAVFVLWELKTTNRSPTAL